MPQETIFSKILRGEIPCDEIYQDEKCLVFRDIEPQAPVHFLVIPKRPLVSLIECLEEDKGLLGHLILIGKNIAKSKKLKNWRTVINTGEESGQTVFHLHIHFLAGRKMSWPPG